MADSLPLTLAQPFAQVETTAWSTAYDHHRSQDGVANVFRAFKPAESENQSMSVHATVLFGQPQSEIATTLGIELARCVSAEIVVGFITEAGLRAIEDAILIQPSNLKTVVVGAGTYGGYLALDRLLGLGVPGANLLVHLGHADPAGAAGAGSASGKRYRPMLHSKIYYFEHGDGTASAVIGSHNLTHYALEGKNGEAGVLLEGPVDEPQFAALRQHIQGARRQATQYDPFKKAGYASWASQYFSSLANEEAGPGEEGEAANTLIIMAQCSDEGRPELGEILYFEVPQQVGRIMSMSAQVHVYLFDSLPAHPQAALESLPHTRAAYRATVAGLEFEGGGLELRADWYLEDSRQPVVQRTRRSVRPRMDDTSQQVRVRLASDLPGTFEYHFERTGLKWRPVLDPSDTILTRVNEDREVFWRESVAQVPIAEGVTEQVPVIRRRRTRREPEVWQRVRDLVAEEELSLRGRRLLDAPVEARPESGSYILLSVHRRRA